MSSDPERSSAARGERQRKCLRLHFASRAEPCLLAGVKPDDFGTRLTYSPFKPGHPSGHECARRWWQGYDAGGPAALHKMLEIEKVAVVSHEMREVQRRGGTFHIHLRGFFSSITPHVAAAVIPPSATSSKTSSGVPIGVIQRE
jgi:hypothetical protein